VIDYFKYFFSYSFRDVPTCFIVGLVFAFFLGTILLVAFLGWKKGMRWSAEWLLVEYLFFILYLTVFVRSAQAEWTYNLSPFWSYHAIREGRDDILVQVVMNVVTFIPIGLLLGSFKGMKWWHVMLIGLCFSMLIELLQLVLKRGMMEVDDVVHNVLGCVIGYWVFVGCSRIVTSCSEG
jgi:glycopeptide antibiotics resistance protein